MGSRAAMQALVPGRVVLVTDASSGLSELGAVCRSPATCSSAARGSQLWSFSSGGAGRPLSLLSVDPQCSHTLAIMSCPFFRSLWHVGFC
jgi:hypothetical protein